MKFHEDKHLKMALQHISGTYDGHYENDKGNFLSLLREKGTLAQFAIDNAMKYAFRYGKKNGYNATDLYKAIHYLTIALDETDLRAKICMNFETAASALDLDVCICAKNLNSKQASVYALLESTVSDRFLVFFYSFMPPEKDAIHVSVGASEVMFLQQLTEALSESELYGSRLYVTQRLKEVSRDGSIVLHDAPTFLSDCIDFLQGDLK